MQRLWFGFDGAFVERECFAVLLVVEQQVADFERGACAALLDRLAQVDFGALDVARLGIQKVIACMPNAETFLQTNTQ